MNVSCAEKTRLLLEFNRIQESAAAYALSTEAAKIIREETPLFEPEPVRERKELVSSFCTLIKNTEDEKRKEFPEIGFLLPRLLVEGSTLDADEVLALGLFLERGGELRKFLLKGITVKVYLETYGANSKLAALAAHIPDCTLPEAEIFRIIDHDGGVRDTPEIKKIRKKIFDLGKDLEKLAGSYSGNENTRRMLQSELPSQRDGRLVLAVKANFRNRIKGIVHEVSSTGQTIFIEPAESVEKNNQILVERSALNAEIKRILKELTAKLSLNQPLLDHFHKAIIYTEILRAKARYSLGLAHGDKVSCFADEPDESDTNKNFTLKLIQARHPLLGKRLSPGETAAIDTVVPIDLSLDTSARMAVITGPNTGGKTVTLKTICLFALMNQTGLALPAGEAVLPVFDSVYADIGDEQSISQSLSTFSAHMINIAEIIKNATGHSLVLLDELGAGTDPEEGCAIAMAILDHFIKTKSTVVLTTHHGMLKNYGYSREGVENASVEFDRQTLSPTYRIIMGIPGESRAVDIAARNGFPSELVEKARNYLDKERSDVSALISGLKEKHRELDKVSRTAIEEKNRLIEDRRKADLKELSLRQKEFLLKQEGAAELKVFLSESRKNLENLVREIREGELTREKTLKVKEFISSLEQHSAHIDESLNADKNAISRMHTVPDTAAVTCDSFVSPGLEVLAGPSQIRGIVLRQDRKKTSKKNRSEHIPYWIVETGSVRTSFPEHELIPLSYNENKIRNSVGWALENSSEITAAKFELNLIGMRLEQALEALRRQIDAAVLSGLREFSVVHGKGDGILQKGIQDYLSQESAVLEYHFSRPEMGGTGRTEVRLR